MGDRCKLPRILCVNCNICVNTLRRHPALTLDTRVTSLLSSWVDPIIITEEDYICEECRDLAMVAVNQGIKQEVTGTGDQHDRPIQRGHTRVCVICGCSLLSRQSDKIIRDNPSNMQRSIAAIIEDRLAPRQQGPARVLSTSISPIALKKCVKNDVELRGFREAHIKDGIAVVRSLHWVERQVAAGLNVSEIALSDQMEQFRSQERNFMGPSFSTIAGAGENGAIIHYSPRREGPQRIIRPDDMLLVDSGGQYFEGTTDITRTRHMSGTPTDAQRMTFTRVLKGQINLATTVLPTGILGNVVEVLARKALWDVGLNYGHGTGHGVGHFLNVHEGPIWILSGPTADDPGIAPKMIYSNEPGYYEVGEYGIRHEDLVETIEMSKTADHIRAPDLEGDFAGRGAVGFRTISLAPHQTACLDVNLLTDFEIQYLNEYHKRVLDTLGPILLARQFNDEFAWLERECAPIARGAAILFTSQPLLAGISILVVWLGYK